MQEEGAPGPTLLLSPISLIHSPVRPYCVCSHPLLPSDTLKPEREREGGDSSSLRLVWGGCPSFFILGLYLLEAVILPVSFNFATSPFSGALGKMRLDWLGDK